MRKPIRVEPIRPWTVWGTLAAVVKFPFRLVAASFAFVMLFAWIFLAWLPLVAYTSGSDVLSMTLRTFDHCTDREVNPLFLLHDDGYRPTAYNLRRPMASDDKHRFKPELIRECRRLVAALWDLNDPVQKQGVLDFGESALALGLFESRRNDRSLAKVTNFAPPSEDEAFVMVGMSLLGLRVEQNADMFRLEELAQSVYPREKDREAALAWAGALYDRWQKNHVRLQAFLDEGTGRRNKNRLAHLRVKTILPPRSTKFLWWIVYQYAGLTPITRKQSLAHWKGLFSSAFPDDTKALGERLEKERRAAGEPLLPTAQVVPWICLVERYLGLDAKGDRDRAALHAFYEPSYLAMTRFTLLLTNPCDDFFLVLFGGTKLHLTDAETSAHLFGAVILVLTVVYGFRLLTLTVIGEWILRLHAVPEYRRYRNGRGHGSFLVRLACYLGVPLLAWALAFLTLSSELRPLAGSPVTMLVATCVGVWLGGAFVGFLTRMVALLLLRVGVDVNRVWWDEIIGLTLGLGLLSYFGNDLVSLGIFALAELLPMLLQPREPEILEVQLAEA